MNEVRYFKRAPTDFLFKYTIMLIKPAQFLRMKGFPWLSYPACLAFLMLAGFGMSGRTACAQAIAETSQTQSVEDGAVALLDERIADLEAVQDGLRGARNEGERAALLQAFAMRDDDRAARIGVLTLQSELARAAGRKSPDAVNLPEGISNTEAAVFQQRIALLGDIEKVREQAEQLSTDGRPAFFAQWEWANAGRFEVILRQITPDAVANTAGQAFRSDPTIPLSPDMGHRLQTLAAIQTAQAQITAMPPEQRAVFQAQWEQQVVSPISSEASNLEP